ncbi:hypothetical protein D9V86_10000 [Bacteroidetes/Chlorobi group bacterium ChocPot_Mid]|nr:MAG: hypothetical protein D9V86_10000 [Bacteroidetes/Chlorobi group bacterium ChocPot_Mid]
MLFLLDAIFVIHLIFMVIASGQSLLNKSYTKALSSLGKGILSLSFFMAALGHFLFGYPVAWLFQRYVTGGFQLLPLIYKEYIQPIISSINI